MRANIAATMSATSANKATNNQDGSAEEKSEETVEGLGEGVGFGDAVRLGDVVAASTMPLRVLDGPCDKLAIRTPDTTYLPPSPFLDANAPGYGLA